jgi:hypothetical protein
MPFPQCRQGNDVSVCGGGGNGGGVGKSLAALMFTAIFMLLVDGFHYPTINNTQPKFLRDLLLLLPCFFGNTTLNNYSTLVYFFLPSEHYVC